MHSKNISKMLSVLVGALLTASSVNAEEAEKKGGVDVSMDFVTNYVWRGDDIFASYYDQKGKSYGSSHTSPAFQPSITFTTPVDGLSFNVWGSFAVSQRNDVDSDGSYQTLPGGSDLLVSSGVLSKNGVAPNASSLVNGALDGYYKKVSVDGIAGFYAGTDGKYKGGTPGYYKEENGLKRKDEVDLTLDYSTSTKAGNFSFGIIEYTAADISAKGTGSAFLEMYIGYALPVLPDLSLKLYSDYGSSDYYWNLAYGSSYEISKAMSLNYGVGMGYKQTALKQGVQDITAKVGVTMGNFFVAYNIANRPDKKMHDGDPNTELPLYLNGGSTNRDGLVTDPSRSTGPVNTITNDLISAEINSVLTKASYPYGTYTYTPRTQLPATLTWLSAGYKMSF